MVLRIFPFFVSLFAMCIFSRQCLPLLCMGKSGCDDRRSKKRTIGPLKMMRCQMFLDTVDGVLMVLTGSRIQDTGHQQLR